MSCRPRGLTEQNFSRFFGDRRTAVDRGAAFIGAERRGTALDRLEPALQVRKVVEVLALGLVRHEAFFAGKPTNYWIHALKQEPFMGEGPPAGDIGKILREGGSAAVRGAESPQRAGDHSNELRRQSRRSKSSSTVARGG